MLSTPPLAMTTRSGLIAGKKRALPSPVNSKEREDNNNQPQVKTPRKQKRTPTKQQSSVTTREEAKVFSEWFQQMLDEDRHNLSLYLADEVILEWFGRTVRTRKKVAGFLEFDMQCSRHNFISVVGCAPFAARVEKPKRPITESPKDTELAEPLDVPETPTTKLKMSLNRLSVRGSSLKKRPGLRSASASPVKRPSSPEWETNNSKHSLEPDASCSEKKRTKLSHMEAMDVECSVDSDSGHGKSETKVRAAMSCRKLRFDDSMGDEGIEGTGHRVNADKCGANKFASTPAKRELGQGDCCPSTSGVGTSLGLPLAYSTRKYVECNGFIEFSRSKNKRCVEAMKWERKCKVRVCYTEDPVNVGEYTIWTVIYSDDIKCKRNLLAAFEEVANVGEARKKLF